MPPSPLSLHPHPWSQLCDADADIGDAVNLHQTGGAVANGTKKAPSTPVPGATAKHPYSLGDEGSSDGFVFKTLYFPAIKEELHPSSLGKMDDRMFGYSHPAFFS
jgi:hypothetical protein